MFNYCNKYIAILFVFSVISSCSSVSNAQLTAPVVPHSAAPAPAFQNVLNFCGKDVNLDRADLFERFDRELISMVYGHSSTLLMLKRANKYFPVMAPILEANGIPKDVLYLACIESTLNPRAYSPAKAAGIWQFIPATAKQYGLEVNDEVDERYNLEKATAAACKYLKSAYRKFGDWPTVMASYNSGLTRISTELEKQQQKSSFDLYLNEETSRYVFRVMALAQIFANPQSYGFILAPEQFYYPAEYEKVTVDTEVEDWPQWAIDHGITFAELREHNPWIRSKKLTNKNAKTYTVLIPKKESLYRSTVDRKLFDSRWAAQ